MKSLIPSKIISEIKATNLFCYSTKWTMRLPKVLQFHKHHQLILFHESARNRVFFFYPKHGLRHINKKNRFPLFKLFIWIKLPNTWLSLIDLIKTLKMWWENFPGAKSRGFCSLPSVVMIKQNYSCSFYH